MTKPCDFRRPGAYDATRPLVLGYVRASLFASSQELAEAREQLALVAQMEGYALGAVFTEQAETTPAALSALIDAVRHYEAKGIVVPSSEHLAVLGTLPTLNGYLQRVTGVRLIVVQVPTAAARPTPSRQAQAPRPPVTPTSESESRPWLIPP